MTGSVRGLLGERNRKSLHYLSTTQGLDLLACPHRNSAGLVTPAETGSSAFCIVGKLLKREGGREQVGRASCPGQHVKWSSLRCGGVVGLNYTKASCLGGLRMEGFRLLLFFGKRKKEGIKRGDSAVQRNRPAAFSRRKKKKEQICGFIPEA